MVSETGVPATLASCLAPRVTEGTPASVPPLELAPAPTADPGIIDPEQEAGQEAPTDQEVQDDPVPPFASPSSSPDEAVPGTSTSGYRP